MESRRGNDKNKGLKCISSRVLPPNLFGVSFRAQLRAEEELALDLSTRVS